ncbi:hypothetical protein [Flagellimonas okinawensis]|uniref:DUF998 domain-containing protein n=1 Tax=Flagellimonas okinawensis TaxID=3031324 RepID=A0ABT5XIT4_9FLAO|nr:hypothetical protein [[Muricauda] okinawensis]MDF0705789.1 hypothetical protein [[Muricauda] okinawensis]
MMSPKRILKVLPTIGILMFIAIYAYASHLYPGGSLADVNSAGFDWLNNHWCHLMRENALNGVQNKARPVAIAGITMLCASMIIFFFQFANHFEKNRNWNITIKVSGTLGMLSACFIFTIYHDIMTSILSVFGTLVIIGMLRALYKKRLIFLMVMGVFCILIVAMNNYFYYNENLTQYSPIIQKIAFILILSWTVFLNLTITKNELKNGIE